MTEASGHFKGAAASHDTPPIAVDQYTDGSVASLETGRPRPATCGTEQLTGSQTQLGDGPTRCRLYDITAGLEPIAARRPTLAFKEKPNRSHGDVKKILRRLSQ